MLHGSINDLPTIASTEALEAAAYPARVVSLIDIGNQDSPYGVKRQFIVQFELPTEQTETDDGEPRPRLMSYFVNVPETFSPKAKLVQLTEVLGLKSGESYTSMIGKACSVDIGTYTKDGNEKNKINSVNKLSKGMDVAPAICEPLIVSEDSWANLANLDLPEWIVTQIDNRVK